MALGPVVGDGVGEDGAVAVERGRRDGAGGGLEGYGIVYVRMRSVRKRESAYF